VLLAKPGLTSRAFLLLFKKYSHEIYYRVAGCKDAVFNYRNQGKQPEKQLKNIAEEEYIAAPGRCTRAAFVKTLKQQ
jgi:hypothetical protein